MSTCVTKAIKTHQTKTENDDSSKKEEKITDVIEVLALSDGIRVTSIPSTVSCAPSAPFCRICHDDDAAEPLISPCACKGTLNYCHASCLRCWLTEKVQNLKEPSCEICKSAYEVRYERVGRRDCGPCRQFRGRREFIHFVVMSFCLFVLASSIAYTSWGAFSTSNLAINFRLSPLAELTYSVYFIIDALCVLVIAVEFHMGVWPVIKKWWSSNLSVVVIDKNNVAICSETLRVVEEASSLLEEDNEEEEDEEEDIEEGEGGGGGGAAAEAADDRDVGERDLVTIAATGGGGDSVAKSKVTGWWVKMWTRGRFSNAVESDLESLEMGEGPPFEEALTPESQDHEAETTDKIWLEIDLGQAAAENEANGVEP